MSDVFSAAQPKGTRTAEEIIQQATGQQEVDRPRRTRRTAAQIAAEAHVDPFDVFDRVHAQLEALPKPVRDRILATLNRIYG